MQQYQILFNYKKGDKKRVIAAEFSYIPTANAGYIAFLNAVNDALQEQCEENTDKGVYSVWSTKNDSDLPAKKLLELKF